MTKCTVTSYFLQCTNKVTEKVSNETSQIQDAFILKISSNRSMSSMIQFIPSDNYILK